MTLITSRQNTKIKQVRALGKRSKRAKEGLFVVEGIRHVGEAVEASTQIEYLLYAPDLLTSDYAQNLIRQLTLSNTPVFITTADILSDLAGKDHPQGILAVVRQNLTALENLTPGNFPWGAVLHAPQDPGNLGTILRTVDAVGASGVIVVDGGVDIYHPTAVRASMGALFWKPVVYTSFNAFASWSRDHGYHIYGSSAKGQANHNRVEYQSPALLFLGGEQKGLEEGTLAICEKVVRLPMEGKTTSLNLSVAAGVLLYQMREDLMD